MTAQTQSLLRTVYTVEQFAAEILCGHRKPEWVCDQIKARKIKAVTTRPYLISQSEVTRFLNLPQK